MNLPYDTFVELTDGCEYLFRVWDEQSSHFRELARDIAKKRGENRGALPTRLKLNHRSLQRYVRIIYVFDQYAIGIAQSISNRANVMY